MTDMKELSVVDTVLRSEKHYCRGAQSLNLIIVVEVWLSYMREDG